MGEEANRFEQQIHLSVGGAACWSLTAGSLMQQEKGTPHLSRLGLLSVQLKYMLRFQSLGPWAPQHDHCGGNTPGSGRGSAQDGWRPGEKATKEGVNRV